MNESSGKSWFWRMESWTGVSWDFSLVSFLGASCFWLVLIVQLDVDLVVLELNRIVFERGGMIFGAFQQPSLGK
jgi:hypothetical protein